jgi:phosphoserine phosphatase RsbU/P
MRLLIADDDVVLRHALRTYLEQWGYEVVECADGIEASAALQDAPPIAIIDWQMPGVDGPTLCQEIRNSPTLSSMYVILLTANTSREDVISGLESGADDYLAKPCDWKELQARLRIGERIVTLQQALTAKVHELQEALANVRRLSGLLPICSYCKRIRDDRDYWQQMEAYVVEHTDAEFSHGICPTCLASELEVNT